MSGISDDEVGGRLRRAAWGMFLLGPLGALVGGAMQSQPVPKRSNFARWREQKNRLRGNDEDLKPKGDPRWANLRSTPLPPPWEHEALSAVERAIRPTPEPAKFPLIVAGIVVVVVIGTVMASVLGPPPPTPHQPPSRGATQTIQPTLPTTSSSSGYNSGISRTADVDRIQQALSILGPRPTTDDMKRIRTMNLVDDEYQQVLNAVNRQWRTADDCQHYFSPTNQLIEAAYRAGEPMKPSYQRYVQLTDNLCRFYADRNRHLDRGLTKIEAARLAEEEVPELPDE
jgi:hypothetical protein